MYKALTSFVLNKNEYEDVDIKKGQILDENFVSQDVIDDLLQAEYIEEYDGTIEITSNGNYDVSEYEYADVDVSSSPSLQDKSVTITQNTTTTIQKDSGYDGLGTVTVTTNVSGADLSEYFTPTIGAGNTNVSGVSLMLKKLPPTTTVSGDSLAYGFARTNFNTLPNLDVSAVTNMANCFNFSTTTASYDFTNWDTSKVTTMQSMFNGCQTITGVTNLDCSSSMSFQNMFVNCKEITTVSLINYLRFAIECSGMFNECRKLTSLTMPKITTGNCINMFAQCQALETAPELDTSVCPFFAYMFYNCQELKNVPAYDASSANNFGSNTMFYGCAKLTDASLNNILAMCISATNYNGAKTLATLGFNSATYSSAKIQSLSNYTAFTNAGWTIGY